jgi:hypothetical protein
MNPYIMTVAWGLLTAGILLVCCIEQPAKRLKAYLTQPLNMEDDTTSL